MVDVPIRPVLQEMLPSNQRLNRGSAGVSKQDHPREEASEWQAMVSKNDVLSEQGHRIPNWHEYALIHNREDTESSSLEACKEIEGHVKDSKRILWEFFL